jgi:hypothetical protein
LILCLSFPTRAASNDQDVAARRVVDGVIRHNSQSVRQRNNGVSRRDRKERDLLRNPTRDRQNTISCKLNRFHAIIE